MSYSIWPTVHAERQALLDDVADLSDADWAKPSLCSGWTVADVFAHLVSTTTMTPLRFVSRFAGAGFNFGRFAQAQVVRESAGGPRSRSQCLSYGCPRHQRPTRTQAQLARRGPGARRGHPPARSASTATTTCPR